MWIVKTDVDSQVNRLYEGVGEVAVGNIRYCYEQSTYSNENTVVNLKVQYKYRSPHKKRICFYKRTLSLTLYELPVSSRSSG